ncbi:MAG: ATP-binding cassette domain-containing protein, partial [Desulfotomaculaceae bacterium]|nr:ATP-binding cassette domain-containing protein [Desulfotomaculaceae bacterium]
MQDYFLSIKSLKVAYEQKGELVTALDSVDLSLPQGQRGVIIGPSGCGKSTLITVLAGLNSHYTGQVLIGGKPPASGGETALILQDFGLLPWKTVWDNVILGLKLRKKTAWEIKTIAETVLEKLGLSSLAKRP